MENLETIIIGCPKCKKEACEVTSYNGGKLYTCNDCNFWDFISPEEEEAEHEQI